MTTDGRLGSFATILKGHSAEVTAMSRALRALVAAVHPGAVETPRDGERCTTYGVGPRKMTEAYAHIMPLRDSVNLGLYHGVALADPRGLLRGTGKGARHLKLTSMDEVRLPSTKAFIEAAVAEREAACRKA